MNGKLIEHPGGILETVNDDGSRDFRGPSEDEGSITITKKGEVWIFEFPTYKDSRVETLQGVMRRVEENFPNRELEISDMHLFKGEILMFMEALRKGDAALFRAIGDMLAPRPAAVAIKEESAINEAKADWPVFHSITLAFRSANGVPDFKILHGVYREVSGQRSEPASAFKKKLKSRRFSWLYQCAPKE